MSIARLICIDLLRLAPEFCIQQYSSCFLIEPKTWTELHWVTLRNVIELAEDC